ncbi:MAG: RDD family protein [Bacilli bacterium]|nr:RDD family protein [Bacilli bacterium]
MKASFKKRLGAYIIDSLILTILLSIISIILPTSSNIINLEKEWDTHIDSYLNHEISTKQVITNYANIAHDIDKEQVGLSIVNGFFILIYFVIYPFLNDGQTLGKKLLKIKIQKDDGQLSLNDLIIRNFIVNGLLTLLISLALIYILPSMPYFITISILNFVQFILVIISGFMVIYRSDKKGIQDILTHTTVVEI